MHHSWNPYAFQVFSSSWGESCATLLLLVSFILFLFLCFFLDILFLEEFCIGSHFLWFHWKSGFDYRVQKSGLLWVTDDRHSVCSMEDDKKSCLFVFICLPWGFWHLLAISLGFILFVHHYKLKSLKKKKILFPLEWRVTYESASLVALRSTVYP